jgi:uncharacterized protein (TIRG00374 family)
MKLFLKAAVTITLFVLILWKLGGVSELGRMIMTPNPIYLLLVFGVNTIDRAIMTFKWKLLLKGRGIFLPFVKGMNIYCASMVWGIFLPATVGADAIRAYSTTRIGLKSNEVIASIIIERMIGFLSALLVGLIGFSILTISGALDDRFQSVWWVGGLFLLLSTFGFAMSFSQTVFDFIRERILGSFRESWLLKKITKFHMIYREYQNDKTTLFKFSSLTFAKAIGVDIGLVYIAGIVPLTLLITRIPIAINGLGVFDATFMVFMSMVGVPPAEALAITLIGRVVQILSWIPWWLANVLGSGSFRPPRQVTEENV